jgi:hypothetical protein
MTTEQDTIDSIRVKAAELAVTYEERETAEQAVEAAEAAVLERAVEAIRPALPALCRKLARESYEGNGCDGASPVSQREYFPESGCVIIDSFTRDGDGSGSLGGDRLVLLASGGFVVVLRAGSWSKWPGGGDQWTATLEARTALDVARVYELDALLAGFVSALDKVHAETGAEAVMEAVARAERLRTITDDVSP